MTEFSLRLYSFAFELVAQGNAYSYMARAPQLLGFKWRNFRLSHYHDGFYMYIETEDEAVLFVENLHAPEGDSPSPVQE